MAYSWPRYEQILAKRACCRESKEKENKTKQNKTKQNKKLDSSSNMAKETPESLIEQTEVFNAIHALMEDMGEIGLGWVAKTLRYRENKSLVSSLLPVRSIEASYCYPYHAIVSNIEEQD
ncbi:hypothetical protein NC652_009968 [Populus alba x Populus x berolinensis]|nr:hypothetical protein NC652_009968 [Populus alba x Populus x berolinensis]